MHRVIILSLCFIALSVFSKTGLDAAYQEGLGAAQTNMKLAMDSIKNFNPSEKFEKYTDNPAEIKYYNGVTSANSQDLKAAGDAAYTYSEDDKDNDATQAALKSFKKNPKIKMDPNNPNDLIIARAQDIMEKAPDIAGGGKGSNKEGDNGSEADCKEIKKCNVEYTKETCREERRALKRICEKVPKITLVDDIYLNCQKHVSLGSIDDCLAGHIQIPFYRGDGYGKFTIPQGRGSRVSFDDCKHGYYYITITNDETGEKLYQRTRVNNGKYIELPSSATQDQSFSFIAHRADGCSCNRPGKMNLYINYKSKKAAIDWHEGGCHDL